MDGNHYWGDGATHAKNFGSDFLAKQTGTLMSEYMTTTREEVINGLMIASAPIGLGGFGLKLLSYAPKLGSAAVGANNMGNLSLGLMGGAVFLDGMDGTIDSPDNLLMLTTGAGVKGINYISPNVSHAIEVTGILIGVESGK